MKLWAQRQALTGVVEGHFFLDNATALFHLSAQLCLAPPQLLLAATAQKLQVKQLTFCSRAAREASIKYESTTLLFAFCTPLLPSPGSVFSAIKQ